MIKENNLKKYYDTLQVLKGVDLHIKKAEIVSIVGASGAAKTTLLQILGTLDKPTFETDTYLEINGEEVTKMNDKNLSKFRNLHLGFIFQFHQLLPEFTAIENVYIPGLIAKRDKKEVEKEVEVAYNRENLAIFLTVIKGQFKRGSCNGINNKLMKLITSI